MSRKLFLSLCLLLLIKSNCEAVVPVVATIGKFLLEAIGHINTLIDVSQKFVEESVTNENYVDLSLIDSNYQKILQELGQLPSNTYAVQESENIQDIIDYIAHYYRKADDSLSLQSYDDKNKILENCNFVLDQNKGIIAKMEKIRLRFQNRRGKEFLKKVLQQRPCLGISDQRFFIDVLHKYLETELKTSALIRYAYDSKQKILNNSKNNISLANDLKQDLARQEKDMKEIVLNFKLLIFNASRMQQSCDLGRGNVGNSSYISFENLFQRIILAKEDFAKDDYQVVAGLGANTLRIPAQCPIKKVKPAVPKCYSKYPCEVKQKQCSKIIDCQEAGQLKICLANDKDPKSTRRYTYVTARNNPAKTCKDNLGKNVEVSIQSGCNCICQENDAAISTRKVLTSHFFDLANVESQISSGSVIAGVRLARKPPLLYWEIKQGHLVNKTVNTKYNSWEGYHSFDFRRAFYGKIDIHELNWFNKRAIFLDFHELDPNHVLTGVKFGTEKVGNDIAIRLEVQQTELDQRTWKLKSGTSKWKFTDHTLENSQLVDVELEAPTKSGKPHSTNEFVPNRFLRFSPSKLESIDAGQTVLPYFDVQAVDTGERICGLGIDLATAEGSGGYIKPIVKHCDILIN